MADDNNKINGLVAEQDDDPTVELEIVAESKWLQSEAERPDGNESLIAALKRQIDDLHAEKSLLASELELKSKLVEIYKHEISDLRELALHRKRVPATTAHGPAVREGAPGETGKLRFLVVDDEACSRFLIRPGRTSLGSSPDNDIQLNSEFISRHHAQIVSAAESCILGDLSSTNGTYVNSNRIKRHALREGDAITIGKHRFKFVTQNVPGPDGHPKSTELGCSL